MGERERWQTAAWVVGAAIVVFFGARALGQRTDGGGAQSAPVRVDGRRAGARGATPSARGGEAVYVHVAGAVRRPGLYRLAPRTRVARAIERAGGPAPKANLAAVNLAAPVQDGQQVLVPGPGAPAPGAAAGAGAGAGAAGGAGRAKVSLAAATVEQLDGLDGIGPTLAKRIVAYRTAHGGFRSLEQLQEVDGIGAKRLEALKDGLSP